MQTRETQITPNELLIRWDDNGNLQGAHVVFLGRVLDDEGGVLAAQPMPPQSIAFGEEQGFPLTQILDQLHVDSLKLIGTLERQIESLNATMSNMGVAHQQQLEQLLGRANESHT